MRLCDSWGALNDEALRFVGCVAASRSPPRSIYPHAHDEALRFVGCIPESRSPPQSLRVAANGCIPRYDPPFFDIWGRLVSTGQVGAVVACRGARGPRYQMCKTITANTQFALAA